MSSPLLLAVGSSPPFYVHFEILQACSFYTANSYFERHGHFLKQHFLKFSFTKLECSVFEIEFGN